MKHYIHNLISFTAIVFFLLIEIAIATAPIVVSIFKHELLYLMLYVVWIFPMIILMVIVGQFWIAVIEWLE